jgi:D-3-phosphoglycerate dehydrogenase
MLLLATRRNVVQADRAVRAGDWDVRSDWDRFCRHTIKDDTLGLYGFGNIAREVAKMAVRMGMHCVTYDPYICDEDLFEGVSRRAEKQSLFEAADVVSVHTPLTDETRCSVGLEELREIDYLINTARGEIVDEEELRQALDEDLVAAGLDVIDEEPPLPDNPLLERDDVILTPHFGTLSVEALRQMSKRAAENVRTVYEGDMPNSAVNAEKL